MMKPYRVFLSAMLFTIVSMNSASVFAQSENDKRMTPEILWKLGRLSGSAVSPDGTKIAYIVKRYDIEKNQGSSSLFLIDSQGKEESKLVADWKSLASVQWVKTKGGDQLWFEGTPATNDENDNKTDEKKSDKKKLGKPSNQAYQVNPSDGTVMQVTSLEDGIANLKVAPTGDKIAFTLDIKLDRKPTEIYPDLPKADARIIDGLMYRHWDTWHDYAYSHLHVAAVNDVGVAEAPVDLMKDVVADCPVPPFGGSEQFAWSPDGKELAFTMKNVKDWAQSTNSDVYLIAADGQSPAKNITVGNLGYDNNPSYSPDGERLVYHSMQRPGFEADRNRLMLLERDSGETIELTAGLDQTAGNVSWMPDSSGLIFSSETKGTNQLFKISVSDGTVHQFTRGQFNWESVSVLPSADAIIATQVSMLRPEEIVRISLVDRSSLKLTKINDDIYKNLELPIIEERFVTASDGEKIQCWVIFPPDFKKDSAKKWPLLTYCQGGPQSQIGQWFSYRWNFHLMASQGYVVVAPNRRGLPGFGQKWNDEISGDWGGQAMQDLLSSTDSLLAEPFIDPKRSAVVGASYGGYSVYWLMGNGADRFCAMIAHCGVFNLESMYGSTEELFFVNHDLGGPYWKSAEVLAKYQKFSPNRFVGNWKTPLLVIHGEKDFRVPVTQGMEAFTAAQVQGVPSRFLYFPDEGHWVQSPQNSILWQRVFFDWLNRYCQAPKE